MNSKKNAALKRKAKIKKEKQRKKCKMDGCEKEVFPSLYGNIYCGKCELLKYGSGGKRVPTILTLEQKEEMKRVRLEQQKEIRMYRDW